LTAFCEPTQRFALEKAETKGWFLVNEVRGTLADGDDLNHRARHRVALKFEKK
jgi:hypothetical protein